MPIPAVAAALYSSIAGALPSALPVLGSAVVFLGLAATHEPDKLESAQLASRPEAAAECMRTNVAALNTRLTAAVQPLHGTETMGVTLKRGVVGDALLSVVIQEQGSGSRAECRPIAAPEEQPDVLRQMISGC